MQWYEMCLSKTDLGCETYIIHSGGLTNVRRFQSYCSRISALKNQPLEAVSERESKIYRDEEMFGVYHVSE